MKTTVIIGNVRHLTESGVYISNDVDVDLRIEGNEKPPGPGIRRWNGRTHVDYLNVWHWCDFCQYHFRDRIVMIKTDLPSRVNILWASMAFTTAPPVYLSLLPYSENDTTFLGDLRSLFLLTGRKDLSVQFSSQLRT